MDDFISLLIYEVLGNSFQGNLLFAVAVFVLTYISSKIFKIFIIGLLKHLSKKTKNDFDDLIVKILDDIGWPFYLFFSLFLSIHFVPVPELLYFASYYLLLAAIAFYVVKSITTVINYAKNKIIEKEAKEGESDTTLIELLAKILNVFVWIVACLFILSNLGYDITTLIAGLGIGGIAVAFALQNVLSDVFASFSIYFDKPFKKGDFIVSGTDKGVVKKIGIKSTRIETIHGEELVISNKELTESRIHNFKIMKKRRAAFTFGVAYETPTAKLKKIPSIVKEIISKQELAQLDRVHFASFGESSLNYEVVYYVDTNDYNKYMDILQEINLSLVDALRKEKISFAYPTHTVYLNKA